MNRNSPKPTSKRTGLSTLVRVLLAVVFIASGCAAQTAKKHKRVAGSANLPAIDQKAPPDSKTPKFPVDAVIHFEAKHRTITLAKAENLTGALADDAHFTTLRKENRYEEIALAFVGFYRKLFKIDAPAEELKADSVKTDELGLTHVRFRQFFSNIPIPGCDITVHLNPEKNVYMVQGRYIPTPNGVATRPGLNRGDAFRIVAQNAEHDTGGCHSCTADLVIYTNLSNDPRLAWQVLSSSGLAEIWEYAIDAQTGEILNKKSGIRTQK